VFSLGQCLSLSYISEQNSSADRDSSGGSTRTERIGIRSTEEYRRSACEDLTHDLKTMVMCNPVRLL
jgi:hypothetical protein